MERKFINNVSLKSLLNKIKEDNIPIYAPVENGKKIDIKKINSIDEISMNQVQTVQSAKSIAFPRVEKLFSYVRRKGDVTLINYDLDAIPETVLFGLHPCDAIGFKPLSGIFNWGSEDRIFNERMKRTTLISVSCTKADEYCFCTSVDGSPGNTMGSDLLLTPVEDGYLVEIITEKGKSLAAGYPHLFEEAPDINKEDYLAKIPVHFTTVDLQKKLSGMFDNEVWKKQSERCLGCGACAFVCPTCACFDIQEDARGNTGNRLRCWDSCGFSLFTIHTSGHNPREVQSQRWRQRLLHKFSYMPERISVIGCTGCGRCSRACPVDINIREHLEEINKTGMK